MLLAIDVGNSHTVFGCFWDGDLKKKWRVSTRPFGTGDELRLKTESFLKLEGISIRAFEAIIASSVVPQMTEVLRNAFGDLNFRVIDHTWNFSFANTASPASSVGADRLVNAETAVREFGAPCIVVDSGTATTICAVGGSSTKPLYLGGAIMPGIELSMEALASRAAKLFSIELTAPECAIGNDTTTAMQSGILFGYAEMVDGMVRRFKNEMQSKNAKVIATGGVSRLLRGVTREIDAFEDDLTLRGIYYLYDAVRANLRDR
ncbi:MAG TPA: type III pantothenate kinase [Oligoflexia bacterium]|nr:type III pantothenate kinase [Oligoflexia bacterium]